MYMVTIESNKNILIFKGDFSGKSNFPIDQNSFVNSNKFLPEDFLFLPENLEGASKMRILTFVFVLLTLF